MLLSRIFFNRRRPRLGRAQHANPLTKNECCSYCFTLTMLLWCQLCSMNGEVHIHCCCAFDNVSNCLSLFPSKLLVSRFCRLALYESALSCPLRRCRLTAHITSVEEVNGNTVKGRSILGNVTNSCTCQLYVSRVTELLRWITSSHQPCPPPGTKFASSIQ